MLAGLSFAVPLALLSGTAGGLRPGSLFDRILLLMSSVALSLPTFWVGLIFVTIFAVQLGWLPPFGFTHFSDNPGDWLKHMIMPAIAVGLPGSCSLARQMRAGLADTMQAPFIRTAWAKGGGTRQVVVGHALKNSAMPAVTVLGLQVGALLGGTVIIEQIFSLPGIGTYMLNAVNSQDFPVIQAVALLFVVINVFASLAVDVTYGFLNPKVRAA
jgi:peptide/nickel transport system permease protein